MLQVNSPGNPADIGWIDEIDALQNFTVSELEEFWMHNGCPMRVRLQPYPDEQATLKGQIHILKIEGTVTLGVPDVPERKRLRDSSLEPGHCPCAIPRERCDYHR